MWFLFGLVTITLCVGYEFWRRHMSLWKAEGRAHGIEYKHQRIKGTITGALVGVGCAQHPNFSVKRQTGIDNFFKRMGVSNEFETGDQGFDDSYYLITDNNALHHALTASPKFRAAIKRIMEYKLPARLGTRAIHCRNGRVWAELKIEALYREENIESTLKSLSEDIEVLVAAIGDVAQVSGSRWADPFVIKAALLLAVSSGLAINGCIRLFRLKIGDLPFALDYKLIVVDALIYSVVVILVFAVIAIYWLGRSARTHIVLIELMTIGAFGIFLSIATEMRDINIEMDTSSPQTFKAQVERKYTSKGRRGRTKYHVVVENWNCDCDSYKLRVSEYEYRNFSEQGRVQVLQNTGYLGYPWISEVKPL